MTAGRYELRRVGVFSLVKTFFLAGGIGGFLIGILEWALLGLIFWATQNAPVDPGLFGQSGMGDLLGAGIGAMGFFLPIFGAIAGAVGGVVSGFVLGVIYNLSARMWGGIEMEWIERFGASMAGVVTPPTAPGTVTSLPEARGNHISPPTGTPQSDANPASPRSSSAMYE